MCAWCAYVGVGVRVCASSAQPAIPFVTFFPWLAWVSSSTAHALATAASMLDLSEGEVYVPGHTSIGTDGDHRCDTSAVKLETQRGLTCLQWALCPTHARTHTDELPVFLTRRGTRAVRCI